MKIKFSVVILSLLAVILCGCSLKTDPPINDKTKLFAFGTYQKSDKQYYIVEDNKRIVILNNIKKNDGIGKRFFVAGQAKKNTDNKGNDYWIMDADIMEESRIHKISIVDSASIDEFGKAGIYFEQGIGNKNIYFSGKYLNFIYSIYATNNSEHTFSYMITRDKKEVSNNKFTLYIRHKDNNDVANEAKTPRKIYSSLDMSEILSRSNSRRITLIINIINLEGKKEEGVTEITQ